MSWRTRWMGGLLTLALGVAPVACDDGPVQAPVHDEAAIEPLEVWNVNDVSFLFPYPGRGEGKYLLPMSLEGPAGPKVLLPEETFRILGSPSHGIGYLIESFGRDKLYPALRVVAARVDPCFDAHDPHDQPECVRQVRLTVQPAPPDSWEAASGEPPVDDGTSTYTMMDASLHLFYRLDDDAFVSLLQGLAELKRQNVGNPGLGVHPVMKREGLGGPFAARLRELLLDACDASRLTRMTMMRTGRSGNNWFWNILDREADGRWVARDVPTRPPGQIGDGFTQWSSDPDVHDGTSIESALFPDALLDTTKIMALKPAELVAGVEQLQRIENPALLSTSEVSCAACHVAGVSLGHAVKVRGLSAAPDTAAAFTAPAGQNTTPADEAGFSGSNMHAFSWFGRSAAVSQRAANESAGVAAFLGTPAFTASLKESARAAWTARAR